MPIKLPLVRCFNSALTAIIAFALILPAQAAGGPQTPKEFAKQYMEAFNKKDLAAVRKLSYPHAGKSDMQDMMDQMTEAELNEGTQYTKFEINAVPPDMEKPSMGPDGHFYKPNLKPTNMVKFTAVTREGSLSTSFAIGQKDGIYYAVSIEPAPGETPAYQFGWQRFSAPQSNWSVMMPNEPEPGRAVLEKQYGKDALKDPDVYGVVKNTADIKAFQHFFLCGEEGKRLHADDNKDTYRAACTTFTPETLKEWFSDAKKNLGDAVDSSVRSKDGKLVQQKDIDFAGSPGKEFEIRDKDGTIRLGRVYWIKDALYELTVESLKESPDRAAAGRFLSSLDVK